MVEHVLSTCKALGSCPNVKWFINRYKMTKKLLWKLFGYICRPTAPNKELNCRTAVVLTLCTLDLEFDQVLTLFIYKGPESQVKEEG